MAARHIAAPGEVPDQTHGRLIERYCKPINELLWDETKSVDLFRSAADVVDKVFGPPPVDKDSFKTQRSTEAVIDAVKGTPI